MAFEVCWWGEAWGEGGGGRRGGEMVPWCGRMGVYGDGEMVSRDGGWGGVDGCRGCVGVRG